MCVCVCEDVLLKNLELIKLLFSVFSFFSVCREHSTYLATRKLLGCFGWGSLTLFWCNHLALGNLRLDLYMPYMLYMQVDHIWQIVCLGSWAVVFLFFWFTSFRHSGKIHCYRAALVVNLLLKGKLQFIITENNILNNVAAKILRTLTTIDKKKQCPMGKETQAVRWSYRLKTNCFVR